MKTRRVERTTEEEQGLQALERQEVEGALRVLEAEKEGLLLCEPLPELVRVEVAMAHQMKRDGFVARTSPRADDDATSNRTETCFSVRPSISQSALTSLLKSMTLPGLSRGIARPPCIHTSGDACRSARSSAEASNGRTSRYAVLSRVNAPGCCWRWLPVCVAVGGAPASTVTACDAVPP